MSSFSLPRADWAAAEKLYAHGFDDLHGDKPPLGSAKHKEFAGDDAPGRRAPLGSAQHMEFAGNVSGASLTTSSSETSLARVDVADSVDKASRQTGDVQIYLYYVRSVGWWASLLFVVAIIGFVFSMSFPSKSILSAAYGCCFGNVY